MWFHWSWETQGSSFRVRNLLSVLRVCVHHPSFYDETDDESDTVWESFSSILFDDDWGICLRNERMFDTFFLVHTLCTGSLKFFRFSVIWKRFFFWSGPVRHYFWVRHFWIRLYGAFLMFFSSGLFLRPHIGAQHVLSLPRLHIQFSSMLATWHVFFCDCVEPSSTASEHAITRSRYTTSIFLWVIQVFVGLGNAKARCSYMSVPVFCTIEKCFVLRFRGSPNVSFDQVRMLSHEQSCGECFFRRVVFQTFRQSFISTFVGWSENCGLGVGSRFVCRMGSEASLCFCLHVCFVAFECCGVCYRGRL